MCVECGRLVNCTNPDKKDKDTNYSGWVVLHSEYVDDREDMFVGTFTQFIIYNPVTKEIKEIKSNDCGCGHGSMSVVDSGFEIGGIY